MPRATLQSPLLPSLALALLTHSAGAQTPHITPQRLYTGVNRPIPCTLHAPDATTGDSDETAPDAEILLLDPHAARILGRAPLSIPPGAPEITLDLADAFPVIWTERHPRLRFVQLVIDAEATGAPLVLEPLLTPAAHRDALTDRVMSAFLRRDAAELTRLLALSQAAKDDIRESVASHAPDRRRVFSALRVYPLRDVVLETSEGPITIRLDPAAAPATTFHFLRLVEGGFYDDTSFHRIINADPEGLPYIVQAGDPTGTGLGGCGTFLDYEPSPIRHARGVVSMARRFDDPNTNGAQFFICLSRQACAKLDGRYTAFARVTEGFDTLDAIAATPVAPLEGAGPDAVPQRPISPPRIERARATPAQPLIPPPATPNSAAQDQDDPRSAR